MRRFYLILGDIVIFYLALLATLALRYGTKAEFGNVLAIHLLPFSIIFAVWVLVFYMVNLYDITFTKNNLGLFSTFFYAKIFNFLFAIAFFYLFRFFGINPRTNFILFSVIELLLTTPWRYYFNRLIARSNNNNNTLIIGLSDQAQEMYDILSNNPQFGFNALGIIDVGHDLAPETLNALVKTKAVKTLILSPEAYRVTSIINVMYGLVGLKINFHNLPDFFEKITGKIPLGAIDQTWFLENLSEGNKRGYEIAKRVFDLLLAIIIGLVALPFFPLIILAIKLDSDGTIFYRQERVGKNGKTFILVKFRNMVKDAESKTGAVWASENDHRVTRVGKFLRRSRIDELPQIWNVIRGEMSFIGPRPERPEFHEKLKQQVPFYEERYLIKPGLTGWAQVKFKLDFKGGMTVDDTYEKLQYDLFYIKNRSIFLDGAVFLKTIITVLKKLFR